MNRFSFSMLVALVAMLLSQALIAKDSSATLKELIEKELDKYYSTPFPFHITVKDTGLVIINGSVNSFGGKLNVFSIVSRVHGVREIENRLDVQTDLVADNIILDEIQNQLIRIRSIEDPSKIQVAVSNGLVILRGTVNLSREAVIAEDLASWWPGVRGVENEIQVLPPKDAISDANLTSIIKELINNYYSLEKNTVLVQVSNGRVTLSGKVTHLWVRYALERDIRHIEGIRGVENWLKVAIGR